MLLLAMSYSTGSISLYASASEVTPTLAQRHMFMRSQFSSLVSVQYTPPVYITYSTMLTPSTQRLAVQLASSSHSRRALSTKVPRYADRRAAEAGPGGRASDAGYKVALFGATGFLGRYVCSELGT